MHRQWQRFQGRPNKFRRDTPHITLSTKGVILMNMIAYELAGRPGQVALLYDEQNAAIGLESAHASATDTFPVNSRSKGRTAYICASPFCRHHEITVDRTMAFNKVSVEKGVLILDLTSLTAVGKGGIKV